MRGLVLGLLAVVLIVPLAGCSTPVERTASAETSTTVRKTTTTIDEAHVLSVGPCDHFRRLWTAIGTKTLSYNEIRKEAKEIASGAAYSAPDVASAANRFLANLTQLDADSAYVTALQMDQACKDVGA